MCTFGDALCFAIWGNNPLADEKATTWTSSSLSNRSDVRNFGISAYYPTDVGSDEMNKHGETIVLKVNKDKCLAGFYALGFEPKEIMGVLYQAITVLCKQEGVDPALQLMQLIMAAEEGKRRKTEWS